MILKTLPLIFLMALSTSLLAQEISLDPEKGWRGRALEVTVSGNDIMFQSATSTCEPLSATNISFQQASATIFQPTTVLVNSDQEMDWEVNIPTTIDNGSYDVVLWEGEPGCQFECSGCFEVMDPPSITGINPALLEAGASGDVSISGTNFCFDIGSPNCEVGPNEVVLTSATDGSTINPTATMYVNGMLEITLDLDGSETPGNYNIDIADGYPCFVSCDNCFQIEPLAGSIDVMGTDLGRRGESLTITIEVANVDVANCNYAPGDIVLEQNGYTIPIENLTIVGNQMSFDVNIPLDAPLGDYNIVLADGQGVPCNVFCEACFTIDEQSGLYDQNYEDGLVLYPNPSSGVFSIVSDQALKMVEVELYSIHGQIIYHQYFQRFMNEQFDLDLGNGTYMLKMKKDGETCYRKLVINK